VPSTVENGTDAAVRTATYGLGWSRMRRKAIAAINEWL
jgi:hypothetical protein